MLLLSKEQNSCSNLRFKIKDNKVVSSMPALPISKEDVYLFHIGENYQAYKMLGAHPCEHEGVYGVRFAVWAEHAQAVYVVGEFNGWQLNQSHALRLQEESKIWVGFIPNISEGTIYKYLLISPNGEQILKADPLAFAAEHRPQTGSVVSKLGAYHWQDAAWQAQYNSEPSYNRPMLIYEVHLGSWRFNEQGEPLSYRELAHSLVSYVKDMGYTHLELLPISEYPFDGSWGYQITGYFAPTSRYGSPADFKYFVDTCHQNSIGVLLDWSPGHFCKDDHGLRYFDGEPMYEPLDTIRAENVEWGTMNFDYGRTEVQSFLISNAFYWFDEFHIDGLRIDAVSNMLYLNYARSEGNWSPNRYGGSGNLEAMEFIKKLNIAVFKFFPQALMIAEESTDWLGMSRPVYMDGMGFNYKWNMGWMNDMLRYISKDHIYRKWEHQLLTFSLMYAFSENYVLPLSHDEVVHGKRSLIEKMPGTYAEKFANLRLFLAYWIAHPGKKLLFMGSEFAQFIEWKCSDSLDWHLLDYPEHANFHKFMKELNWFYRNNSELWELDCTLDGFEWLDCHDFEHSIIAFQRKNKQGGFIVTVCNFTPIERKDYCIGVPVAGMYTEVFNSSNNFYNSERNTNIISQNQPMHGRMQSITMHVPPLSAVFFKTSACCESLDLT